MKAIVYTSNAGHTKRYAEMLGEETGLPVFELDEACKNLSKNAPIIYLGWLMAGQVKGCKKAMKTFDVKAVVGVGMAKTGSQLTDVRKANPIPDDMPVFTLQGGFEMDKLSGVYRVMMGTMKKTVGKGLSDKENKTPEDIEMLDLLNNGSDMVRRENLAEILAWIG